MIHFTPPVFDGPGMVPLTKSVDDDTGNPCKRFPL